MEMDAQLLVLFKITLYVAEAIQPRHPLVFKYAEMVNYLRSLVMMGIMLMEMDARLLVQYKLATAAVEEIIVFHQIVYKFVETVSYTLLPVMTVIL